MNNIISVSGGNDSVAMLQWVIDHRDNELFTGDKWLAIYCNTGWGGKDWHLRIKQVAKFCRASGIKFKEIKPKIDFENLIKKKKMFPRFNKRFCTDELKIKPIIKWRLQQGYNRDNARVWLGVRAEESPKRAKTTRSMQNDIDGLIGIYPLAYRTNAERDALVAKTGIELLGYRSLDCNPCIFSTSKIKIRQIDSERVELIAELENFVSKNRNASRKAKGKDFDNNEIFGFFSNTNGAKGIKEQVKWAGSSKGTYAPNQADFLDMGCDSGYCSD